MLLKGLQFRLERLSVEGGVVLGEMSVTSTQYADDLKLFAWPPKALTHLFLEVQRYLRVFGLRTSAEKGHVIQVGAPARKLRDV